MKQKFISKNFRAGTLILIEQVNRIIAAYEAQGYTLTLRQVYYQLVARGIIPNTEQSYKKIGSIINDARLAGLIDWSAIEDRTRNLQSLSHWSSPGSIIHSAYHSFRLDKWEDQHAYPEVWVEKEALIGVVAGVCREWDVPYFACRGYVSASEMYGAAQRLLKQAEAGKELVILHLGDHDPSGIDMTRDIIERLKMFLGYNRLEVRRIALTWEQIEEYDPPPNPAKDTDSRFDGYRTEYGDESWELDALEPSVITDLIETNLREFLDEDEWDKTVLREDEHRKSLLKAASNWDKVATYVAGLRDG